jgi:phage shock protein A
MPSKKKKSSKPKNNHDQLLTELTDVLAVCRESSLQLDCVRGQVEAMTESLDALHKKIEQFDALNCRQRLQILELEESNEELRKLLYTRPFWRRIFG